MRGPFSAVKIANRRLGFYALHQAACISVPGAKNRHFLVLLKSICHNLMMPVFASFGLLALLLLQQFHSVPLLAAPKRVRVADLAPPLCFFFICICIHIIFLRDRCLRLSKSASGALELEIHLHQTPPPGLRQFCTHTAYHRILLELFIYVHYLGRGALPLPGASPHSMGWNREARLACARRAGRAFLVCMSLFCSSGVAVMICRTCLCFPVARAC